MKKTRRQFLLQTSHAAATLGIAVALKAEQQTEEKPAIDARAYLSKMIYTRQEVDDWFAGRAFPFAKYSGPFGWLLPNARFKDGMDGSVCTYTYSENKFGERLMIAHADQPCRINTYGDSFTQCHQVNDNETWQEVLAGHLCEPVRNFGIGGWSVYQAYLRMRYEETRCPADLIILNIYDDDHYRNLDSWRNLRKAKHKNFIEPTLPYLKVDLATGQVTKMENPCPTKESFYNLCDLDWCVKRFGDDFTLNILLAHANSREGNPKLAYQSIMALTKTHGIETSLDTSQTASAAADQLHTRAALAASMKIVEWTEEFAKANGKKVLYVLSYCAANIARQIKEKTRFDQPFVDFLKEKKLPCVDLMEEHVADYAKYKIDVEDYLSQYYIGHYNPRGNFFTAFAIKNKVVEMLDPKPTPYRPGSENEAPHWPGLNKPTFGAG